MTKQEYEKVRQEVAKRYKDRISDLERKNMLMNEEYMKRLEEIRKLKRENACLRSKLDEIPDSIKNIMELIKHI